MKNILLIILLLIGKSIFAQQEVFNDKELSEDLKFLTEKLIEIHPDPFFSYSQLEFEKEIATTRSALEGRKISRNTFAKMVMPIIARLGDGHTELKVPLKEFRTYEQAGGKIFPYDVLVRGDSIWIRGSSLDGKRLLKINGISISEVLANIRNYISAETASFRDAVAMSQFRKYLWFELGEVNSITISDGDGGAKKLRWEEIISNESDSKKKSTTPYSYTDEGQYDWLEFNDMSGKSAFKKMLKAFNKDSDSQTLIIDLRNNGGGHSNLGDALIKYLYSGKYKQVDRLEIKSSKTQKRYFYKTYVPIYLYPILPFAMLNPAIRATVGNDGKTHVVKLKDKKAGGKIADYERVFALTSNYTFSSATILVNALQHYGIAEIVGMETGGVTRFYGDNVVVQLPNTGLYCTISFKKFVLPGAGNKPEPVQPDILVEGVDEIEKEEFMEIINSSN